MITANTTPHPRVGDDAHTMKLTHIRLRALIKRRKQLLTEDDFALILALRHLRSATIQEIDPCAFSAPL